MAFSLQQQKKLRSQSYLDHLLHSLFLRHLFGAVAVSNSMAEAHLPSEMATQPIGSSHPPYPKKLTRKTGLLPDPCKTLSLFDPSPCPCSGKPGTDWQVQRLSQKATKKMKCQSTFPTVLGCKWFSWPWNTQNKINLSLWRLNSPKRPLTCPIFSHLHQPALWDKSELVFFSKPLGSCPKLMKTLCP